MLPHRRRDGAMGEQMPPIWHCWWSIRRVGGAIHRHHRPHRWIGRGARHAHHKAGTAKVVKVLVCTLAAGSGGGIGWVSTWAAPRIVAAPAPSPFYGETGPEWWSDGTRPRGILADTDFWRSWVSHGAGGGLWPGDSARRRNSWAGRDGLLHP